MARPRFNGQRFTNPIDPLGFHAESRYRESPHISQSFMSNEHHFAENRVFNAGGGLLLRESLEVGLKASLDLMIVAAKNLDAVAKEVAEQVIKEVEALIREAAQKAADEAYDAAIAAGKSAKEALQEGTEAGLKAGKKVLADAPMEGLDDATKLSLKNAGEEGLEQGIKAAGEAGAKGGWKGFRETLSNPLVIKGTGTVAVGTFVAFAVVEVFGEDGIMSAWVDGMTGADCDEKALDAGHDEGTEDYEQFVLNCQKRAETKMAILGAFTIVAVVGGLYLLIK